MCICVYEKIYANLLITIRRIKLSSSSNSPGTFAPVAFGVAILAPLSVHEMYGEASVFVIPASFSANMQIN